MGRFSLTPLLAVSHSYLYGLSPRSLATCATVLTDAAAKIVSLINFILTVFVLNSFA